MASSARIEELERKFTENPRRFFAPLANEFRKAGQLTEAIALCREFVPQQPGHMSGHIVLGQSLFEAGDYSEARTVFTTALELDPENLIALRHLGDIARLDADIPTARMWYQRVLEVDPRNEDTVALLASVNAAVLPPVASAGGADGDAAGDAAGPVDAADGAAGWGGINPERATDVARDSSGPAAAPSAPLALPRLVRATPSAASPDPVLDGMEQEAEAPRAPAEPGYAFVTETMAQLYLQQGHREEALKVYRQLMAQRPNDAVLRARVDRLEAENAERLHGTPPVVEPMVPATLSTAAPVAPPRTPSMASPALLVPPPAPVHAPMEPILPVQPAQPAHAVQTARAFFAAFATRRPASLHGIHATPVDGSASSAGRSGFAADVGAPPVAAAFGSSIEAPRPQPDPATLNDSAYDAYDASAYGAEALVAGNWPTTRSGDFEYDQSSGLSSDLRPTGSSEYHDFTLPDLTPLEPDIPPAVEPVVPSAPTAGSKTASQTGSVSVLFPGAVVPGVDEAAAATLSSAFGGPSASQPLMIPPPAMRPAATELSLDAIFGEDEVAIEAEQFSSWLSGLKKK